MLEKLYKQRYHYSSFLFENRYCVSNWKCFLFQLYTVNTFKSLFFENGRISGEIKRSKHGNGNKYLKLKYLYIN